MYLYKRFKINEMKNNIQNIEYNFQDWGQSVSSCKNLILLLHCYLRGYAQNKAYYFIIISLKK